MSEDVVKYHSTPEYYGIEIPNGDKKFPTSVDDVLSAVFTACGHDSEVVYRARRMAERTLRLLRKNQDSESVITDLRKIIIECNNMITYLEALRRLL